MAKKKLTKEESDTITVNFDKEKFFSSIWALSGRNAFPTQLRNEYIETLWEDSEGSKKLLKKKELLNSNDPLEVFKKIVVYDKDLAVFKNFVKRFHQLSPKAIRFLKTPEFSETDKKKIQGMENKEYTIVI